MKRILLVLACMPFICCLTKCQDVTSPDYYWYNNEKIFFEKGDQTYIIYDEDLLLESDKNQLVESGNVSYKGMGNLKWGITKPNVVIEDLEHVMYLTSSYKDTDGNNLFVTHRFYVKLKDSHDLSVLQEMNKQYNIEIDEDSDLSLWYILRCKLPSSFNALELANIFYESGKFATAEPEFMGSIHPDAGTAVNQVTNVPTKTTKKFLHNGMLIIESGGNMYNAQGELIATGKW